MTVVGILALVPGLEAQDVPIFDESAGYRILGTSDAAQNFHLVVENDGHIFFCRTGPVLDQQVRTLAFSLGPCLPLILQSQEEAARAAAIAQQEAEQAALASAEAEREEVLDRVTREAVIAGLRASGCSHVWEQDEAADRAHVERTEGFQEQALAAAGIELPDRRTITRAFEKAYSSLEADGIVSFDSDTMVERLLVDCEG